MDIITFIFLFHSWHLIDHRYWQPISGLPEIPNSVVDAEEGNRDACPEGMVHVYGQMKQDRDPNPYGGGTVEALQKTVCTKWINKNFPERCAEFDHDAWVKIAATLPTRPMDFCIDRYEYPNKKNQYPMIFVNYYEAESIAISEGKRLCNEEEWTFACEGPEALPYPNGYTRPNDTCQIDKTWRPYHASKLLPRTNAGAELDRLWQGEPSGTRPLCSSPFGVMDLVGSIDEWTTNVRPSKYKSVLKGGYWGPVRTRCRPSTRNHSENHTFYQQGFRACVDYPE